MTEQLLILCFILFDLKCMMSVLKRYMAYDSGLTHTHTHMHADIRVFKGVTLQQMVVCHGHSPPGPTHTKDYLPFSSSLHTHTHTHTHTHNHTHTHTDTHPHTNTHTHPHRHTHTNTHTHTLVCIPLTLSYDLKTHPGMKNTSIDTHTHSHT